jgi:hypothetical protein
LTDKAPDRVERESGMPRARERRVPSPIIIIRVAVVRRLDDLGKPADVRAAETAESEPQGDGCVGCALGGAINLRIVRDYLRVMEPAIAIS